MDAEEKWDLLFQQLDHLLVSETGPAEWSRWHDDISILLVTLHGSESGHRRVFERLASQTDELVRSGSDLSQFRKSLSSLKMVLKSFQPTMDSRNHPLEPSRPRTILLHARPTDPLLEEVTSWLEKNGLPFLVAPMLENYGEIPFDSVVPWSEILIGMVLWSQEADFMVETGVMLARLGPKSLFLIDHHLPVPRSLSIAGHSEPGRWTHEFKSFYEKFHPTS